MVLGKRHGSLIKRTTSMRMFNVDTTTVYDASQPSDHDLTINPTVVIDSFTKNDGFLMTCNRCNRNLCHRRDIYMYRGDNAFCSLECRDKQIKLDERKVKVSSKKSFRI